MSFHGTIHVCQAFLDLVGGITAVVRCVHFPKLAKDAFISRATVAGLRSSGQNGEKLVARSKWNNSLSVVFNARKRKKAHF